MEREPGCLVLVAGPSGSGKDTLIQGARETLCSDPTFVFPRRVITRPPSDAERSQFCEPWRFAEILAMGGFAITWAAHGLNYGIPASIGDDLAADRTVICNVSRTVVQNLRSRYSRVVFIEVTASAEILLERLASRGRHEDGCIERRVRRSAGLAWIEPDATIVNDGAVSVALSHFIRVIRATKTTVA